ncbi:MAG: hypothetical protein ACE5KE_10920 [Methanosarcinales archaeon]
MKLKDKKILISDFANPPVSQGNPVKPIVLHNARVSGTALRETKFNSMIVTFFLLTGLGVFLLRLLRLRDLEGFTSLISTIVIFTFIFEYAIFEIAIRRAYINLDKNSITIKTWMRHLLGTTTLPTKSITSIEIIKNEQDDYRKGFKIFALIGILYLVVSFAIIGFFPVFSKSTVIRDMIIGLLGIILIATTIICYDKSKTKYFVKLGFSSKQKDQISIGTNDAQRIVNALKGN